MVRRCRPSTAGRRGSACPTRTSGRARNGGDGLELRGPIGGYFVWDIAQPGPLLLVAGGSGIVPLMAMLRHHARADTAVRTRAPVRLLYSARTWDDVIYREELERLAECPEVRGTFP